MLTRTLLFLQPGKIVDGRYELLRPLGRGGFAEVYAARQLHIDREVALKILHVPFDASREGLLKRERFTRDARLAARIKHPGVVTIYDFGVEPNGGFPYIAMELLEGHDLGEELERHGGMSEGRALRLLVGALDALQEGHRQGIVHKDLKPSNLYLVHPGTPKEHLKIIDFGIAMMGQEERITQSNQPLGTAAYMAPEYIRDQIASPALDVYQVGLILTEVLSGAPLVQGETPIQCMFRHLSGDLVLPAGLVDTPLGAVVRRALLMDHQQRYADAGAFAVALREVLGEAAPQAPARSRRAVMVGAAAALALALGALGWALWPPAPGPAVVAPTQEAAALPPLALREAPWKLGAAQRAGAQAAERALRLREARDRGQEQVAGALERAGAEAALPRGGVKRKPPQGVVERPAGEAPPAEGSPPPVEPKRVQIGEKL
jgi:hypothetical protein